MSRKWELLTEEQAEKVKALWKEHGLDSMKGCGSSWGSGYEYIWSPDCIQLDGNYTIRALRSFVHILEELQKN